MFDLLCMILSQNVNHSLFDSGIVPHVCDIALRGGCTSFVAQLKFETLFLTIWVNLLSVFVCSAHCYRFSIVHLLQ